jgi:hypothetical protein
MVGPWVTTTPRGRRQSPASQYSHASTSSDGGSGSFLFVRSQLHQLLVIVYGTTELTLGIQRTASGKGPNEQRV